MVGDTARILIRHGPHGDNGDGVQRCAQPEFTSPAIRPTFADSAGPSWKQSTSDICSSVNQSIGPLIVVCCWVFSSWASCFF